MLFGAQSTASSSSAPAPAAAPEDDDEQLAARGENASTDVDLASMMMERSASKASNKSDAKTTRAVLDTKALDLVKAGSSSLRLAWRAPHDFVSLEVDYRRAAWFVASAWSHQAVETEDVFVPSDGITEVRLHGLEQQTAYDVRIVALLADGTRQTSAAATFRTLALAPPLDAPPCVKCARHDRLLLHWVGPAAQADEVVAYRVRYYDCEPRWPVKHEVEAKLASRLLRPSEQTAQFLQGLVAMRVPTSGTLAELQARQAEALNASENDEPDRLERLESSSQVGSDGPGSTGVGAEAREVHFWLMNLAPSRMYYVQVAAVTAGGQGQWSPRSSPLFTWRVAPTLLPPRQLFRTHASVVVGLSFEQLDDGTPGQDEEVEKIEVTLSAFPNRKANEESQTVIVAREASSSLAARFQELLPEQKVDADEGGEDIPFSYAVSISSLQPFSSYSCTGRTITNAGVGALSPIAIMETLAVAPEVGDLRVDSVRHDAATISWCIKDECVPAEAVVESLGTGAEEVLSARKLRGFKVRLSDRSQKTWTEVLGVRARAWHNNGSTAASSSSSRPHVSLEVAALEPNTIYFAQVCAVAHGAIAGQWCEPVEITTERLAPLLPRAPEPAHTSRCGATISWPTPEDIGASAPILGYVVYIYKEREKGLQACARQLDLPISGNSSASSSGAAAAVGTEEACAWCDGDATKATFRHLEPDTCYCVQVAARTARGVGERSAACRVVTRPTAPDMGGGNSVASNGGANAAGSGPRCVEAYWNRLLMRCDGPVPDWGPNETCDVTKYRARYYECARFGPNGAWQYCDVAFTAAEPADGPPFVEFWLGGLSPEKQYVVQLAAVTDAGQGRWSKPSDRVSTWRVAPGPSRPRVLFRTHSAFIVGWHVDRPPEDSSRVQDEDVTEFVVRVSPSGPGAARAEVPKYARVTHSHCSSIAAAWQNGVASSFSSTIGSAGSFEALPCDGETMLVGEAYAALEDPPTASCSSTASWPRDMMCEDPANFGPSFVTTVQGLSPSRSYVCAVSAVTGAGEGRASPPSAEMSTLPVAPQVEGILVDEVSHDQIQVSWEHLRPWPVLTGDACESLDLSASIEELELRGYAVRCALWATWTRLNWREPAYAEVDALPSTPAASRAESAASSNGPGRVHFAVTDLEPERQYVVEVRAHSSRGAGEWCRVGDQPICTAIVAPAPPAPELVYATPHALTFSFAGVEDQRVVAYEVRRFEGWTGGWRRPSKPLKFDRQSLAVRVTSEQRWVVHMDQLQRDRSYALQLRGVTQAGGVTRWSARSEAMRTSPATAEGEDPDAGGVGVNEGDSADAAIVGGGAFAATGTTTPGDEGKVESLEDFSKKLEAILAFTMDYATTGVKLPAVRIPAVKEQAEELLRTHKGSMAAAVDAAARVEDDASWRTKLPDFLIQQVPVVGCSTLLLRELWRSIRRTALIAHIYGHDTRSADVQAMILTCLVPAGGKDASGAGVAGGPTAALGVEDVRAGSRKVALIVSRALAKETFVRATGMKYAGNMVSLLEDAGRMLRTYNQQDSVQAIGNTGNAAALSSGSIAGGATLESDVPANGAALHSSSSNSSVGGISRFGRRTSSNEAVAIGGVGAAGVGGSGGPSEDAERQPTPERVAEILFRPQQMEERPAWVGFLLVLWLLPIIVTAARFVAARLFPLLAKRIQMELPLAGVAGFLIALQVATIGTALWVHKNLDNFLSFPATLVFLVYSAIPGMSICFATRALLVGAAEAPFFALLGLYNLSSGYLRWAEDLRDDALLEQRLEPRVARGRDQIKAAREWLWIALLLDFFAEELLGRVCRMHSVRILGPPLADDAATLIEYRTLSFAMGLVAARAQARLLELLQRRAVLLRMLGARKAIFAGLSLLLMGAFAVVQQRTTLGFLRDSSPTPWWCCAVLWVRQLGAIVGVVLPVTFHVLLQHRYLGALSPDTLVPITLALGVVLGHMVSSSFTALWLEKKEHLESDYRVLYLFPHMSAQARGKASVAMRMAFKRGAETTKNIGVEWALARMTRSAVNWAAQYMVGRTVTDAVPIS